MTTCYHCGKPIKNGAKIVCTNPPIYLIQLGDFPKSFHPSCWNKAEAQAEAELKESEVA